jgi:hypothetical protein
MKEWPDSPPMTKHSNRATFSVLRSPWSQIIDGAFWTNIFGKKRRLFHRAVLNAHPSLSRFSLSWSQKPNQRRFLPALFPYLQAALFLIV